MINMIEKLPMHLLDFKKYRKNTRKRFDSYRIFCRFVLFKEYDEKYCQSVKNICNILFKTINDPNTFVIGNQHFLFSLLESHMDFLESAKKKCAELDKDSLNLIFDVILQKNNELKNVLLSNIDSPVTKEQFIQFMKQKQETENGINGSNSQKSGK
jgi:hypothetical protein